MRYEVCDMDSYITWPYQIADHYCKITRMYNKNTATATNCVSLYDLRGTCIN